MFVGLCRGITIPGSARWCRVRPSTALFTVYADVGQDLCVCAFCIFSLDSGKAKGNMLIYVRVYVKFIYLFIWEWGRGPHLDTSLTVEHAHSEIA